MFHTILTQDLVVMIPTDERTPEVKPGVDFIGWFDADWLYLLPEAAFLSVVRFCRDSGEHFPIRQERLRKDLVKAGISKTDTGRLTASARIDGQTKRVLQINIQAVEELLSITGITTYHRYHHFKMGERDVL